MFMHFHYHYLMAISVRIYHTSLIFVETEQSGTPYPHIWLGSPRSPLMHSLLMHTPLMPTISAVSLLPDISTSNRSETRASTANRSIATRSLACQLRRDRKESLALANAINGCRECCDRSKHHSHYSEANHHFLHSCMHLIRVVRNF